MKTAEENWEDFEDSYVCFPWFEPEERERTYEAMKVLCQRMPEEDKDRIPVMIIVFAPPPYQMGAEHILYWPACPEDRHHTMLYLSPELESRPQEEVNATVAHEFAHAILGHDGKVSEEDPYRQEREADTLIATWSYRPTNSCRWMQKGKKK
jgi:hypothetical protein